jgi:hypothetical protein
MNARADKCHHPQIAQSPLPARDPLGESFSPVFD